MRTTHKLIATVALLCAQSLPTALTAVHAAETGASPMSAASAVVEALKNRERKAREEAAKREEAVIEINDRDPAMRAAFESAQSTLDDFLKVAASKDPKYTTISLRVGISEGKRKEYFWITPFKVTAKGFEGAIDNEPTRLKRVKEGQTWRFVRKDVVDWMYVDASKRTMHGNYTTCAQLLKAPAEELAQMKRAYGLDCQKNGPASVPAPAPRAPDAAPRTP